LNIKGSNGTLRPNDASAAENDDDLRMKDIAEQLRCAEL
jgi:hypothetical protein